MGLDSNAVIVPGEGHFYIDPTGSAAMPTGTGVPPVPWIEVGHTERDNPLTVTRDGGERSTLPSWQSAALRESVSPITYALEFGLLQHDELGLSLYYGGGSVEAGMFKVPKTAVAQEHPLFVRIVDGSAVWAEHFSRTSILGSDSEEADPENLMSMPVTATILSDDNLDYLFGIYLPDSVLPDESSSSSSSSSA